MSEKIAVRCKTEEEWDKVRGKHDGGSSTPNWTGPNADPDCRKHGACIYVSGDESGYDARIDAERNGYTIISAQTYLREVKDEVIFQAGDRVECIKHEGSRSGYDLELRYYIIDGFGGVNRSHLELKGLSKSKTFKKERFKLATNKPTTTKEETTMNISDNFVEVFDSSAKLAKKMAVRFGEQYGDTDRDLIALERDKGKLMAILEAEEEKEQDAKK